MAVISNHLTTSNSAATASSFDTASITPTANYLVLIAVSNGTNASGPPTITGNSLTWVQVRTKADAAALRRITLFRALGSLPTSGVVTIDYGSQTPAGIAWSIAEFGNVDLTGTNGSGAIVQSTDNENSGAQTGITVTLAAFQSTNNATYGAVRWGGNSGISPGSGFTELGEIAPSSTLESEWKNSNDTSVDWTWASASQVAIAIATEIKFYIPIIKNLAALGVG